MTKTYRIEVTVTDGNLFGEKETFRTTIETELNARSLLEDIWKDIEAGTDPADEEDVEEEVEELVNQIEPKKVKKKRGRPRKKQKRWSKAEEQYIKDNRDAKTIKQIAKELGRTQSSVKTRAKDLGITKKEDSKPMSQEEVQFIKENYRDMKTVDLATMMNRSYQAVYFHVQRFKEQEA
jgi:hypothetical protein